MYTLSSSITWLLVTHQNSHMTSPFTSHGHLLLLLILTLTLTRTQTTSINPSNTTTLVLCNSTPYPKSCLDSLKLSISIPISLPPLLSFLLHSLSSAISSSTSLLPLLSPSHITERQKGAILDCQDLHRISISSLQKSSDLVQSSPSPTMDRRRLNDVKTYLSAALTNKNTCLEGIQNGGKPDVVDALQKAYQHVTNSLSLVSKANVGPKANVTKKRRVFHGFPKWLGRKGRRLLETGDYDQYDPSSVLTVAADGTENFTTISDAIAFAPNMSDDRTIIIVRAGVYQEYVEIGAWKTNIVLLGEGSDVTIITGSRSVRDGWTTFRSATVAVSGEGFLARDIAFTNTAGPAKAQAVALRVNADLAAIYRCTISGYQDTLYVHSFRQFYRDCDVYGTVDFIFGNAAVIFQNSNIYPRLPLPAQSNVVTAQSRDDPNEATGISIQNCSIVPADDLAGSNGLIKTFLGRPWRNYSTAVYIESYIDAIVDPSGWCKWTKDDNDGLDTLYYGEYMNDGPGAGTEGRVDWAGFHVMDYEEAYDFTVSEFIYGDEWLDSTSFPYDDGV